MEIGPANNPRRTDIDLIIFDMDDTLVATAALWRAAEETLLRQLATSWSAELAQHYKGMNALDVAATIHRQLKADMPLPEAQALLRNALIGGFAATKIQPMAGAVECVRRMGQIGPLAVASGSPPPAIHEALRQLDLTKEFRLVISSEAVPRGKPEPDVFLAAAVAMRARPGRCLVFEDSLIGVRAARAAGMACLAVPSGHHAEIAALATGVFDSLQQVSAADVRTAMDRGDSQA